MGLEKLKQEKLRNNLLGTIICHLSLAIQRTSFRENSNPLTHPKDKHRAHNLKEGGSTL